MKIIIGLGNPGKKYQYTRHNVGFNLIDYLAKELVPSKDFSFSKKGKLEYLWLDLAGEKLELVKPQAYMNRSGLAVAYIKKKYPRFIGEDLYVIHDDLDLKLGTYKIQFGKGPKIHNGLLSIYQHLKTEQFWHVRIGIDSREGDRTIPGDRYVLGKFSSEEKTVVSEVISQVASVLVAH